MVTLEYDLAIFIIGMPNLSTIEASTLTTYQFAGKDISAVIFITQTFSSFYFDLD